MTEALYSTHEYAQFRGPTTSDKYNERVENLYKDLITLSNKVGLAEEDLLIFYRRLLKEHLSMSQSMTDLEYRLDLLEAGDTKLTFGSASMIDNDRFVGTDFFITPDARCSWDFQYSIFTLPKIDSSSFSKLKMANSDGKYVIPSSFEALANGVIGTADSSAATLESSDIYAAILQEIGSVWERNVIVNNPNVNGAQLVLWIRFPNDLIINENTNCIILHPFPVMGCDILDIQYTSAPDVSLSNTTSFEPLNSTAKYDSQLPAIGWTPPGGWLGDEITNSGPKIFYFDPLVMTGIRVVLRQRNYYVEDDRYIYSYGLSKVDARYEKFTDTGKTMIRFDAPAGRTISEITNVLPDIWNVSEAALPDVFSYRVIWEVPGDLGIYTTSPVLNSSKVWIEVSLQKTLGGGTPVLSGLKVEYL